MAQDQPDIPVTIPGYDQPVKFPATMSQDEIKAAAEQLYSAKNPNAPPPEQTTAAPPTRTWGQDLGDLAAGFPKAAVRTTQFFGDTVPHFLGAPGLGDIMDKLTGQPPGTSEQIVRQRAQATNAWQVAGGLGETALEIGLGLGGTKAAAATVLPTEAKAAAQAADVLQAAKNFRVTLSPDTLQAAQGALDLQSAGHTLPTAAKGFIQDIVSGAANSPVQPYTYYEHASNVMSALRNLTEQGAKAAGTTPEMASQVSQLLAALSKDSAQAAGAAGKGVEYARAMNMYAKAKQFEGYWNTAKAIASGAQKVGLEGGAIGLGYYGGKKLIDWLTGQTGIGGP